MYRYQDGNGNWVYTDREPPSEQPALVSELPTGDEPPSVAVSTRLNARTLQFIARNEYPVPVEVIIALDALHFVEYPEPDQVMRWIVDPESSMILMSLDATVDNAVPQAEFRYIWLPGDPRDSHAPQRPYRAPFAVANEHQISQTFPVGVTHTTPDSWYAVDIAMPIGTDIYAARGGLVFEVASTNFRGGTDPDRDGASANIVRIMHDDGSHAVYAHLAWNSIRVRPGDRVERGEYIADSGNTGFTTGPHLHFAVMVNRGMRLESVPITFEGPNYSEVLPATGNALLAY
jgi:murein DD-endopeptidase MepM/ murein hydrolase activator NlpD